MSREIKFRAWDKKRRNWVHLDRFRLALGGKTLWDFDIEADRERFDVQQFTGLKDKNGVEIYEGDILAYQPTKHPDSDDLYIAEWHDHGFYGRWTQKEHPYMQGVDGLKDAHEDMAIIGNIYENPELLQGAQS